MAEDPHQRVQGRGRDYSEALQHTPDLKRMRCSRKATASSWEQHVVLWRDAAVDLRMANTLVYVGGPRDRLNEQ